VFKVLYTILFALIISNVIDNYGMGERPFGNQPGDEQAIVQNQTTVLESADEDDGYDSEIEKQIPRIEQEIKTIKNRIKEKRQTYLALCFQTKQHRAENRAAGIVADYSDSESDSDSDDNNDPNIIQQSQQSSTLSNNLMAKKRSDSKFQINSSVCWGLGAIVFIVYFGYRYFTLTDEYYGADDKIT